MWFELGHTSGRICQDRSQRRRTQSPITHRAHVLAADWPERQVQSGLVFLQFGSANISLKWEFNFATDVKKLNFFFVNCIYGRNQQLHKFLTQEPLNTVSSG